MSAFPPPETWMADVQPGDMLRPRSLWNQTERPPNRIPSPCSVLAVERNVRNCQSHVLITIATANGERRELDAGWFLSPGG